MFMYRWKPGLGSKVDAGGPVLLPSETEVDKEGNTHLHASITRIDGDLAHPLVQRKL